MKSLREEESQRRAANPDDERGAVRPRAVQEDDVEDHLSKSSGDLSRDLSGSCEMQVEGQAIEATAQVWKRLDGTVWQPMRQCQTAAWT